MYQANPNQSPYNQPPTYRRMERQNGLIGGVCGGLGVFFGVNPWLFRVIFLILAMPGGAPGVIPYLILWLVIPKRQG